jgi:malonyl-CoA O-methyltransferase
MLNKIARDFDEAASKYNKYAIAQDVILAKLIKMAEKFIKQDSQILDIGCGTGRFAHQFINNEVTQFDLSLEMLEIAKNGSKNLVQGDMHNLPFKDESYDVVVSSMALQWSDNLSQAIDEIFRVAKKSGKVIIAIPIENSLCELKEFSATCNIDMGIMNFINISMLEKILQNYNCNIVTNKFTLCFDSYKEMFASISKIGAKNKRLNQITKKQYLEIKNNAPVNITWDVAYIYR